MVSRYLEYTTTYLGRSIPAKRTWIPIINLVTVYDIDQEGSGMVMIFEQTLITVE